VTKTKIKIKTKISRIRTKRISRIIPSKILLSRTRIKYPKNRQNKY